MIQILSYFRYISYYMHSLYNMNLKSNFFIDSILFNQLSLFINSLVTKPLENLSSSDDNSDISVKDDPVIKFSDYGFPFEFKLIYNHLGKLESLRHRKC